jgi:hypothetical protein
MVLVEGLDGPGIIGGQAFKKRLFVGVAFHVCNFNTCREVKVTPKMAKKNFFKNQVPKRLPFITFAY